MILSRRDPFGLQLPLAALVAIPVVWAVAVLTAVVQNLVLGWTGVAAGPAASVLRTHVPYALAWAAATPFILRSARRRPVQGPVWRRNALVHLGTGIAFVLLTNALVRAPLLRSPGLFVRDLAEGLVTFGPGALLAWGVIVAIGHGLPAPRQAVDGGGLVARTGSRITILPPADIQWVHAASNYVRVGTARRTWLLRQPLGEIETRLAPPAFIRIHRSTIVAVRAIREVRPRTHGDAEVLLSDGSTFRVPRTRKPELMAALEENTAVD